MIKKFFLSRLQKNFSQHKTMIQREKRKTLNQSLKMKKKFAENGHAAEKRK